MLGLNLVTGCKGNDFRLNRCVADGRCGCVVLSKRQMNRPRRGFVAPKYGLVTGKALLGRFAKYRLTVFPQVLFLPARFFLFLRSLPSVFSHGRTQFHTSGIVPLRALKSGNRWLFSYGRVGTTVRTRRYGGADASVRSESQVLSTVKMGSADAFFALEKVYLCERTLLLVHSDVSLLKYLTRDFLEGRNLRKYASAENAESGKCDVKTGGTLSL